MSLLTAQLAFGAAPCWRPPASASPRPEESGRVWGCCWAAGRYRRDDESGWARE